MRAMLLLYVLMAACATTASAEQGAGRSGGDETAIREVVKKYVDAREQRDATAVSALFTADADQLTSSGEWRKGREALVKGAMASSQNNAGKRTITIETVRFPAPGIALADGAYSIAGEGGATRNMRTAFVLVKDGEAWRISAIRNMLPAAQ